MSENWAEIITSWKGEMVFESENASGGKVQMGTLDGTPSIGPMQLLLVALAGCSGMDIVSILEKKRVDLKDFQMQVRARRSDDFPKVWEEIQVTYLLWAENLDPKEVEQAIQLSEEKYCSVGIMLKKAVPVRSKYQILKPGEKVI